MSEAKMDLDPVQIIVGLMALIMTVLGSLVGFIFYGHINLEADHKTTKELVGHHDAQLKNLWGKRDEDIKDDKEFTRIYWSAHPENKCNN